MIRVVLELMTEIPLDGVANYALLLSFSGDVDPRRSTRFSQSEVTSL